MMFEQIAVIGGGTMGAGIAEVCARAGSVVVVHEVDEARARACSARISRSLDRAVEKGKLDVSEANTALDCLSFTTDLGDVSDADLVIEAIVEDEAAKVELFSKLDAIVRSEAAVLASNTSSIPIMKLAMATSRPDRVVGLHFFNPVPVLKLIELVPSLLTSEEASAAVTSYAEQELGKLVIRSQDRAGFVVNALLIPYVLSAIRMFESGFATAEDIDKGMVEGAAHPMGPLALADLIGLDTTMAVAESLYEEFKEPLFAPPPLLSRMVDAGLLGRKSSQGFFTYRE
jgi:3-hydroxybutyryl-CoA dehydrogenase